MLQSIHFKKNIWDKKSSKEWIKRHNIIPMKPAHETENWIQYRISPPSRGHYYSKYITDGVLFIFN